MPLCSWQRRICWRTASGRCAPTRRSWASPQRAGLPSDRHDRGKLHRDHHHPGGHRGEADHRLAGNGCAVCPPAPRGGRPIGDTVGAGFSGSFPAMDLAVIAACQVMGVELIYISSVGHPPTGPIIPPSPSRRWPTGWWRTGCWRQTARPSPWGGEAMWGGWTRPAQRRSGVGWRRRDCSCWRSRTTGAIWSCASSSISRRAPSTALWQWEAT